MTRTLDPSRGTEVVKHKLNGAYSNVQKACVRLCVGLRVVEGVQYSIDMGYGDALAEVMIGTTTIMIEVRSMLILFLTMDSTCTQVP